MFYMMLIHEFMLKIQNILLFEGWSAPSALGIAGLGGGFEIGAEVSLNVIDFLVYMFG